MKKILIAFKDCRGFTLVELLIAMVVGTIVTIATYNLFLDQQRHYVVQDLLTEMHQNARVAMDQMTREIRMAGCCVTLADFFSGLENPISTRERPAVRRRRITTLASNYLQFTVDFDLPGGNNAKEIRYFYCDQNGATTSGWNCGGNKEMILRENITDISGAQIIAENITGLGFLYGIDVNQNGILDDNNSEWTSNPTGNFDQILRTIRISITTRTSAGYPSFPATDFDGAKAIWDKDKSSYYRQYTLVSEVSPRNVLGNL